MHLKEFGSFGVQFGLIRGSCELVAQGFLDWQNEFLREHGMRLTAVPISGAISNALQDLLPRTAPIAVRYLFWPLNEEWTLYFDNGRLGTDASPPSVLASRLHTDGMRISLADHTSDQSSNVLQYGATIFEYFEKTDSRRLVFVANDAGKWSFGQEGAAFGFENEDAYRARLVSERFPRKLLLHYLKELNASLDGSMHSPVERGPGILIVKSGSGLPTLSEFHE